MGVAQDRPKPEWEAYVLETIDRLDRLGSRGFAFNLLTRYSDPERIRCHRARSDSLSWKIRAIRANLGKVFTRFQPTTRSGPRHGDGGVAGCKRGKGSPFEGRMCWEHDRHGVPTHGTGSPVLSERKSLRD